MEKETNRVRLAQIGVDHPHAMGFRDTLLLMPEVEVVALCDPRPEAARPLIQAALQKVPLYADVAALLRQEQPEAVLITLPNDQTPEAIVQSAEAGCHIYAEKPCARTGAEFRPAMEAIRTAGVRFATGYLRRFSPVALAIRGMVQEGLLGSLISIETRWITTGVRMRADRMRMRNPDHFLFDRERSGGGILHWLGCHWLDFMRWVSFAEVTEVASVMATLSEHAISVEDTASLSLRYDNGMVGSLHCSYVTDQAVDQLFFGLRGTLGWVYWERDRPELVARSVHPAWQGAPERRISFELERGEGYGGNMGLAAMQRFIASFRGEAESVFQPEDALRVLEVLDAAHESDAAGRRVALPPN